jgi:hypothetical protein
MTKQREQRIPRIGDLPVVHLGPEGHYSTPKADDPEIITFRRRNPGVAKFMAVSVGANVARSICIECADELPTALAAREVLLPATINSLWYEFAEGEQMNRRALPYYDLWNTSDTSDVCTTSAAENLGDAATSLKTMNLFMSGSTGREQKRLYVARRLKDAVQALVAVSVADTIQADPGRYTEQRVGEILRSETNAALGVSRTMWRDIGTHPSLHQLANRDSDLSVHIRRKSPSEVRQAMTAAQDKLQV